MAFRMIVRRFASSSVTTSNAEKFPPLEIRGLTVRKSVKTTTASNTEQLRVLRHLRYPDRIDWTNIWPAAATFHHSIVPLHLRQGYCKNQAENHGISPEAYANAELMKIPNFLHLTEAHIAKHCEALKKFCTVWPSGLNSDQVIEKHYPVEVIHSNYAFSAPSIRDSRARSARVKIRLSSLHLNDQAKRKLLRLAIGPGPGKNYCQYDWKTDILELSTSRCPSVRQNIDFLRYALTVLTLESKETQSWERNSPDYDWLAFDWENSQSRKRLLELYASRDRKKSTPVDSETIEKNPVISEYRNALERLWSENDILHCDPWVERPRQPRYRHQPFPDILDVPFQPMLGADNPELLTQYGRATRKLVGLSVD